MNSFVVGLLPFGALLSLAAGLIVVLVKN